MIVQCPNCGEVVVVNGFGRKRLNIPLKNIFESLKFHQDISIAAEELHCSQGYIYNALKANGLKFKDLIIYLQ